MYSQAYAICTIVPCVNSATQPYNDAKNNLKEEFDNIDDELENVKKEYDKLLEQYKESNKKLDIAINVSKNKLLKEKEILFLLKKHIQLQSIENNIKAEN